MEKTIRISDNNERGNLKTLEIGFGTRDRKEKEMLRKELKIIEKSFRNLFDLTL